MPRKSARPALNLTSEQRARLTVLAGSGTAPAREVERARILLGYADGATITELQRRHDVGRPMIYKCIDRALADGTLMGTKDRHRRVREHEVCEKGKAWVIALSKRSPREAGVPRDTWTIAGLQRYVVKHAVAAGFERLSTVSRSTFWRILHEAGVETPAESGAISRKGRATRQVLLMRLDELLQPYMCAASSLSPFPQVERAIRSFEDPTQVIIAAIDLQSGHIFAQVKEKAEGCLATGLLEEVDSYFPQSIRISVLLDKQSMRDCARALQFMRSRPERFCVERIQAGSWFHAVECTYSRILAALVRQADRRSSGGLSAHLRQTIAEINADGALSRLPDSGRRSFQVE